MDKSKLWQTVGSVGLTISSIRTLIMTIQCQVNVMQLKQLFDHIVWFILATVYIDPVVWINLPR